jgi:hypothetical protein
MSGFMTLWVGPSSSLVIYFYNFFNFFGPWVE